MDENQVAPTDTELQMMAEAHKAHIAVQAQTEHELYARGQMWLSIAKLADALADNVSLCTPAIAEVINEALAQAKKQR